MRVDDEHDQRETVLVPLLLADVRCNSLAAQLFLLFRYDSRASVAYQICAVQRQPKRFGGKCGNL